ncbi:MAG: hypothetical protein ACLQJR_00615 [Stellaceae bacterium]
MSTWDPHDPELMAWIDDLSPEAEYVVREAMRIEFEHCRGAVWQERVDALLRQIKPSDWQKARLNREVREALEMIRKATPAASRSRAG